MQNPIEGVAWMNQVHKPTILEGFPIPYGPKLKN